jgi:FtsZ-binding cell division protein ZapB
MDKIDKLHEEHVKQAKLVMQKKHYSNIAKLLNMEIEYMKEKMNSSEKPNS